MEEQRPDPDELLRRVVDAGARDRRGKHTIFFGAAPGVGKTYAMLEAARSELEREKRDVVIGVVETHGRYETAALVLGVELVARRHSSYRGIDVEEFDLDAALKRRPALILVDELAHTNAPGSRHPKRWQDVEELLGAGIDVFSTLNVQHVESLNDVVAKITGVIVRETVPDSVFTSAHEVKLCDLPPDDLLERLRDGKVYVPSQAERAVQNFFRKGNLIALRELSLRHTAERVDAQMRAYRSAQGIEQTWAATEQLLVAVGPSPHSARLIRAACRMATALHAPWFAVYVEDCGRRAPSEAAEQRLNQNLRLAAELGATVVTLTSDDSADALLRFARERNITKIIVGKPRNEGALAAVRGSLVDRLVRGGSDVDVFVTAGEREPIAATQEERAPWPPFQLRNLLLAPLSVLGSTLVAWALFGRHQLADVVMVYLLGIVLVSLRGGLSASLLSALLCVAAFDFIFVPPYYTFAVADLRHTVTFATMFLVAVLLSGLTQRVRRQAESSSERERRTRSLFELTRELSDARGAFQLDDVARRHLTNAFGCRTALFVPDEQRKLKPLLPSTSAEAEAAREAGIADWVWHNQREAGLGTSSLSSSAALYLPLIAAGGIVGVLALTPAQAGHLQVLDQRRQLDAFVTQIALALERDALNEQTLRAQQAVEAEQLRSSLLSSVSHDLRTPLSIITGAAGTLLSATTDAQRDTRLELTRTILSEAERLSRLIENLLDMTRLQAGALRIKKEWLPLEELIGAALNRLEPLLGGREVRVSLPSELLQVRCDPTLLEQVLINLLENAVKYGRAPLEINARPSGDGTLVEVADSGPGIPEGEASRVFEKFQRGSHEGAPGGVGLGLAICRAIVAAHGGRIWVENREGGGASFRFSLPNDGQAPEPVAP
ncbi:MAG: sensor histidine kinase KdpD [Polyangiaceae bacterium]